MKKFLVFFGALCAIYSALGAQEVFYEGQGGKNLGGVRVSEIAPTGLSNDEAELLPLIQMTLSNDFNKYAGITVPVLEDAAFSTRYTLTGTIRKTGGAYFLTFIIKDNSSGTQKTSYGPKQCTLQELRTLKGIKAASEELIAGMGVTLTQAGKNALRTTATNEAEAMNTLAKSAGATGWDKIYYTYQASQLDPALAEASRRLREYQTEIYKAPEISFEMPDIRIPEIKAPEFKAPEIKIEATGNIGADIQKRRDAYNAQKEASRIRQESGNRAMKDLQDAFLAQFKAQSEAVKKRQADLLAQRDILLGQQRTLLAKQRQTIAQLRETENSYDTFFTEHPPFEIIYDPEAAQVGRLDLVKGTIDLQAKIASVGTNGMQVIPFMIADFEKGLGTIAQGFKDINAEFDRVQSLIAQVEAEGKNALLQLVKDYAAQTAKVQSAEKDYAAQLERLDTVLQTNGYAQLGREYAVKPDAGYAERLAREYTVQPVGYNAAGDKILGDTWSLTKWNKDETRTFAIEARLENEAGKTIGTASVNLTNRILAAKYSQPTNDSAFCIFRNVLVNDITDTMTVSIQRVNGRNVTAAANAGYIKISPLEADGYTKDGWNMDGYDKDGCDRLGFSKDGYDRYGYGKDGYNRLGYDRYGYDKNGYDKDGFGWNGYDTNGYNRNGYDRTGYDRNGYNRTGYNRNGYDKDGYNKDGYGKDGLDKNGYDRLGYDKNGYNRNGYDRGGYGRDGFNINGRNKQGQTRRQAERARRQAERIARIEDAWDTLRWGIEDVWESWRTGVDDVWGEGYVGLSLGGGGHIQPSGGFGEIGLEAGGKWFIVDFGLGVGGGSLKVHNEMLEEALGSTTYWDNPLVFSPRLGAAFPINFSKARLNLGGGIEFLGISVEGMNLNFLDWLVTPYAGARLDIAFTEYGGLLGFIGYRAEFTPADKMETYFGNPSFLRHTIFAGIELRTNDVWGVLGGVLGFLGSFLGE